MSTHVSTPFLAKATPEEAHASLIANSAAFSGPLPLDAYLRRESVLANVGVTANGGLTGWVFATSNEDGDRRVLCSCETIKKRALLAVAGQAVQDITAYGIASVYTPPENRGRGYAGLMVKALGDHIEKEGIAAFSVLYSDIGKHFYARHGWVARESCQVDLPVRGRNSDGFNGTLDVKLLTSEEVYRLCNVDEAVVTGRLKELAATGRDAIAILPDQPTFAWMKAREDFLAKEILGTVPDVNGAMTTTASGTKVWCFWTRWYYDMDPKKPDQNSLHILRLAVEDPEYDDTPAPETLEGEPKQPELVNAIEALLSAAQQEANNWNISKLTIWNPSSATLAAAQRLALDAKVHHRDQDSIASLRMSEPAFRSKSDSIIWTCNEKFGWC